MSDRLNCAPLIKEIGRGKDGARSLDRDRARALWSAVLAREISDLELGAVLLAMRIKGESIDELLGFLDATHASLALLADPRGATAPVVIPSYNGARNLPNLVPLLAGLLAQRGVPVLVHGVMTDPMASARSHGARVTTAEVFAAMDLPVITDRAALDAAMAEATAARKPLFVDVQTLAPKLSGILDLRPVLGVRNSSHSLCKLLQPFAVPALRLASYTHPEYQVLLSATFERSGDDVLLLRATEGEAVANARRAQRMDWFHAGERRTVVEPEAVAAVDPALPESREAGVTARWIAQALAGAVAVPAPVLAQVEAVIAALAVLGGAAPTLPVEPPTTAEAVAAASKAAQED
ncbi:DNA-binding protein YbiB [Derxia gummosa]|uniref:DNA-binding protein YbiB n=1 Tax=Derxia gummosa DSM 723 TaxID=1121388 RepID=A0A8B6XBP3_9BURK|nr:DNA-binding protein YbiB [Derxia gummosa]